MAAGESLASGGTISPETARALIRAQGAASAPRISAGSEPWPGGTVSSADGTEWYLDGSPMTPAETGSTYTPAPADVGSVLTRYDSATGLESSGLTIQRLVGFNRSTQGLSPTIYADCSWTDEVSIVCLVRMISTSSNRVFAGFENTSGNPGIAIQYRAGDGPDVRALLRRNGLGSPEEVLGVSPGDMTSGVWLVKVAVVSGDVDLYVRQLGSGTSYTDSGTWSGTFTSSGAMEYFRRFGGAGDNAAAYVESMLLDREVTDAEMDAISTVEDYIAMASDPDINTYLYPDAAETDGDTVTTTGDVTSNQTVTLRGTGCLSGGLNQATT